MAAHQNSHLVTAQIPCEDGRFALVETTQDIVDLLNNPNTEETVHKLVVRQLLEGNVVQLKPKNDATSDTSALPPSIHIWTDDETKLLLSLRLPMEDIFTSGKTKHDVLWGKIQTLMKQKGVNLSVTQITNKWDQLKKRYKEVKDNNRKTGRSRKEFKYEAEFDNLFGEKASTNPAYLIDSIGGATDSATTSGQVEKKRKGEDKSESMTGKEGRKKKKESQQATVTQLLEEIVESGKGVKDMMEKHNTEKMERFDRFLDIYERSTSAKK